MSHENAPNENGSELLDTTSCLKRLIGSDDHVVEVDYRHRLSIHEHWTVTDIGADYLILKADGFTHSVVAPRGAVRDFRIIHKPQRP